LKPGGFVLAAAAASEPLGVKRVLCVGGTAGIGYAVATSYLEHSNQVEVVVVGRRQPRIAPEFAGRLKFVPADLSKTSVARQTANSLKDEHFDIILFTVGFTPSGFNRTSESIETDLAISYLSRHVMLEQMFYNGLRSSRVFIMGFAGLPKQPALNDINWESVPYSFFHAHMNTHIFNEGLVHYYAHKTPSVSVFGLNPGLILSDGFRGLAGPVLSSLLAKVCPDQNEYAKAVLLPLFASQNLHSGSLFNNRGQEINPGPFFGRFPEDKAQIIVAGVNATLRDLGLQS